MARKKDLPTFYEVIANNQAPVDGMSYGHHVGPQPMNFRGAFSRKNTNHTPIEYGGIGYMVNGHNIDPRYNPLIPSTHPPTTPPFYQPSGKRRRPDTTDLMPFVFNPLYPQFLDDPHTGRETLFHVEDLPGGRTRIDYPYIYLQGVAPGYTREQIRQRQEGYQNAQNSQQDSMPPSRFRNGYDRYVGRPLQAGRIAAEWTVYGARATRATYQQTHEALVEGRNYLRGQASYRESLFETAADGFRQGLLGFAGKIHEPFNQYRDAVRATEEWKQDFLYDARRHVAEGNPLTINSKEQGFDVVSVYGQKNPMHLMSRSRRRPGLGRDLPFAAELSFRPTGYLTDVHREEIRRQLPVGSQVDHLQISNIKLGGDVEFNGIVRTFEYKELGLKERLANRALGKFGFGELFEREKIYHDGIKPGAIMELIQADYRDVVEEVLDPEGNLVRTPAKRLVVGEKIVPRYDDGQEMRATFATGYGNSISIGGRKTNWRPGGRIFDGGQYAGLSRREKNRLISDQIKNNSGLII